MPSVTVGLGARSYDVLIESDSLDRAGALLTPWLRDGRAIVVTDENVARHVLPRFQAAISVADAIILPAGEATKDWAHLQQLCDVLLAREIDRADHIVALGGGMIGDLTGFAASIVKRGCGFVQVPTTLLAQVDSSVGGKTAINSVAGKNLIGAFHQPSFVLIDPTVLKTLPERERRAGYAEVVKYGLLGDANFFEWCETNASALIAGDIAPLEHAIDFSVRAKAEIVVADERETQDRRALLNLGHTFGHALEAETGFSDKLLHGEAVAAGMALAFAYSARLGHCPAGESARVGAHLRSVRLPDGLEAAGVSASGAALVAHMRHDKKKSGDTLPFILARAIGQAYVDRSVSLADVAAFLDDAA